MKKIYLLISCLFFAFEINAQIINIPDALFKNKLVQSDISNYIAQDFNQNSIKIDTNSDGEIQISEALNVGSLTLDNSGISSLVGVEYFINLRSLVFYGNSVTAINLEGLTNLTNINCYNNLLTSVDLTPCPNLVTFVAFNNHLTSLNLNGLTQLEYLSIARNSLTSLNTSSLSSLQFFYCYQNLLTSLDLSNLSSLMKLWCDGNQLQSLNFTHLNNLTELTCSTNQLLNLNLTGALHLSKVECQYNFLSSINLSGCYALKEVQCYNNQLTSLDLSDAYLLVTLNSNVNQLNNLILKNGSRETSLSFANNANLKYVCCDLEENSIVANKIYSTYNYSTCSLNDYCSFTPGGNYYTVQGNAKLDNDLNGCDVLDSNFSNLKLSISDGTNTSNYISNLNGNHSISLVAGNYTIVPVLENSNYYTISPSSLSVDFPNLASPLNQNFCVTPNGTHIDIDIEIIPISVARPGFDTSYKLIYKNKGTAIQSGYIELHFDDNKSDFVSAIPNVTTQVTNLLTWDYTNLQPFERREIVFIVNINSPTEIPAINSGDYLGYGAIIFPMITDEEPDDNHSDLKQIVVNSLDPNDKTCTRGTVTDTEAIGNYVDYVIRFENTGTYPAENIVVKDMIDLTKFDISTLIPISSSHDFVTKINDNKVEFIFENINLPFDNATNDGYIAFKIKTLPTLVVGDTFTNNASIYFDYNFPIITNIASTTIQALANPDFDFGAYFSLSPIPTKNVLNIQTKNEIQLSSISIYNTLGQLVLVITEPSSSIDVSNLKAGNYFIKVVSNKGTSNAKFIKQ